MGQKYLAVLTRVFFIRKCMADYSWLLRCPRIHLVCPSTFPPFPNTKFCISTVFIFSWGGGGADYCNVPPVIAGRNWKQCCFGEGLGGRGHKKCITEQCKSGEFLCSLWCKLLASVFSFIYITLFADRFSYSCPSRLWLPWKRSTRCPPPIITLGRYFTYTIKNFIHFPRFVFFGPHLTPLRSEAVRRHFFSMSLFESGNQSFNIAAVAVFLWVIFTIVTCLGNATVTETAAECYWKSMVRG